MKCRGQQEGINYGRDDQKTNGRITRASRRNNGKS